MIRKIMHFDSETTGTSPRRNGMVQLSGIIEIDGEIKEEFNFHMRIFDEDEIDDEALKVTGMTLQQINSFMDPRVVYTLFIDILEKYVNKYDREDKFYPCGYNGYFDYHFLSNWFKKIGDNYFGSWFNHRLLDPLPILRFLNFCGIIDLPNYKLGTVCEYFGISLQAHDALSDVRALREVMYKLKDYIVKGVIPAGPRVCREAVPEPVEGFESKALDDMAKQFSIKE